jgi:hypothetical protein
MVWIDITLIFGTTTNGGTGNYSFALPFTAAASPGEFDVLAKAYCTGGGLTGTYPGQGYIVGSGSTVSPYVSNSSTDNRLGNLNQNNPGTPNVGAFFPIGNGSIIKIAGVYSR